MTGPYADTDPCPGANKLANLPAWQHAHLVSCQACGRLVAFTWWHSSTGHTCGRCHRNGTDA